MPIPYQLVSIVDRPVPYAEALEWQNQTQQGRQTGKNPDTLFLLEHPAVITLGRSSVPERDLLVPTSEILETGIEVYEADRGGEITYHAPGQLIGYPILELAEKERDLHRYLRSLEEVIIATLKFWDIEACRKDGLTGVWVK
jgi:lipoyl(octanoyl) transferase